MKNSMILVLGNALIPKGPEIEILQDLPPGLNISSESEHFKRATHQTLIFVGNSEGQY